MESAFDKITRKLHDDFATFVPVYLQTVDNVSSKLNTPYRAGEKKVDLDVMLAIDVFAPMQEWAARVAQLDYDAVAKSVIPDVWLDVFAHFRKLGITVSPVDIMRLVMGPIVGEIEEVVKSYVVAQGNEYFRSFTAAYQAKYDGAKAEYAARLEAAAPAGGPSVLDDLYASGLYGHAFNVAVAAMADHSAVLPTGGDDPIGLGAASFDTSYSAHWMQVGLCESQRSRILPLGLGIKGILSMKKDGKVLEANVTDEARIECHDGSLKQFASTPSKESCKVVELPALLADARHRGSVTRGYPPELSAKPATCAAGDAPDWLTTTTDGNGETEEEMRLKRTTETSGCGCVTAGSPTGGAGGGAAALVLGAALAIFRRRTARRAAALAAAVLPVITGCSETTTTIDEEILPGKKTEIPGETTTTTTPPPGSDKAPEEPLPEGLPPAAKELLTKLGTSTWHGIAVRGTKTRAVELSFRASRLQWGEVQNPFGPARKRELRTFTIGDDATLHAVVSNPNTWLDATPNGREDDYRLTVVEGTPRKLRVTSVSSGKTEEYVEGGAGAEVGPHRGRADVRVCRHDRHGLLPRVVLQLGRLRDDAELRALRPREERGARARRRLRRGREACALGGRERTEPLLAA
jgi:MYXO-CTERM domain-containing protein